MSIQVINEELKTIEVSLNHWGKGGETSYFPIAPNKDESWGRSDSRGFVMYIKGSSEGNGPWYVKTGTVIKFHEDGSIAIKGTARQI